MSVAAYPEGTGRAAGTRAVVVQGTHRTLPQHTALPWCSAGLLLSSRFDLFTAALAQPAGVDGAQPPLPVLPLQVGCNSSLSPVAPALRAALRASWALSSTLLLPRVSRAGSRHQRTKDNNPRRSTTAFSAPVTPEHQHRSKQRTGNLYSGSSARAYGRRRAAGAVRAAAAQLRPSCCIVPCT